MKKKILLGFGALALAVVTVPMFAAFEAHVINVTATIENALSVNTEPIAYGTVFPEEYIVKDINVDLSQSFVSSTALGVEYVIRQKPKCADSLTNPTEFGRVKEDGVNQYGETLYVCEDANYQMLPLLCPFLSKHDGDKDGDNDGDLDAFHGPLTGWTASTTIQYQVPGYLTNRSDITDNWDIDLRVPCFKGSCAQDNVIPEGYQLPLELEHDLFGCDLWIEVTRVNRGA